METKVNGSYQKFAESLREIVCDAVQSTVKPEMELLQTRISDNRQIIVSIASEVTKIKPQIDHLQEKFQENKQGLVNIAKEVNKISLQLER